MKILLTILFFIVGGWYYLVNYHYTIDKSDKSLENCISQESNRTDIDDMYETTNYDEEEISHDKKSETIVETNIHYSVYDESSKPYKCDGRTRCAQMHSCEEAKYFLANCKGVVMDGDGDGIPCESQWCNSGIY